MKKDLTSNKVLVDCIGTLTPEQKKKLLVLMGFLNSIDEGEATLSELVNYAKTLTADDMGTFLWVLDTFNKELEGQE